jgi:hypothetical protein
MSITLVRKSQIRPLNIIRSDINTTTSGSALITKVIAGTGLTLSSTGVNPGTGDVTITLSIASASVLGGVKIGSGLSVGIDGTISVSSITWGSITGTLSTQTDLQAALDAKYNNPTGTVSQYIDGTGAYQTFPSFVSSDSLSHEVKAGVAINKGQAVYVTGADGTNMIVGLASNASESTSSKTIGLLMSTVSTNGMARVLTEGLLAGLNTNGANAGDPVWLGTGGNLIYGLLNKPSAPAHLVFIGVVTRVNTNNGEIFVKVQNGFEMKELHDYVENGVQNNYVIAYESSTSLYKPKSVATLLGYTAANDANVVHTTGNESIAGIKTFSDTTQSTSVSSGAVVVNGGVGITKNLYVGGDINIAGNLTIGGTSTIVNAQNLSVSDNMIYLNNGIQTTITNVVGNGSTVVYTTLESHNYTAGMLVTISGVDPSVYNLTNQTITAVSTNSFTIAFGVVGLYVSGGTARAKTSVNPDLGFAGGYNDGTYAHTGLFRDATDNTWKFFKGYTPEPDASPFIDTSHGSFAYADLRAYNITGNSFVKAGGTSVQFLKADGSIDSNTYATQTYVTTAISQIPSPTISVQQVNIAGTATESYSGINILQFDEDSGFDVTNPSAGIAKVAMNSTFKYWKVDGVQKLTAVGLDTVNFVSGSGISITANGSASPQELTISVSGYNNANWDTAFGWGNHAGLYLPLTGNHTRTGTVYNIGTFSIGQNTNGTAVIDAYGTFAYFGCNTASNGMAIGPSGAATFSSSVTATSFSNAGLQSGEVFNATKSNAGYFVGYLQNTSATGYGLYIQNGSNSLPAIRISNAAGTVNAINLYGSGIAEFGSTVTSGGNFELTSATTGLKSNFYDTNFYASNASYWNVTSSAAATGGALLFKKGYEGTTKGYVYWDGDGFGLLNNLGGWSVRVNYGGSYGGSLYGNWESSGTFTAVSLIKSGGTSTQYLMADGSTSTLTNPITGTGTTNYLPKFTGASALGNSLLQENATTIGLGVTPLNAYSDSRVLEIGANGIIWTENATNLYNSISVGLNYYYNWAGSPLYKNTGLASTRYSQYLGEHQWSNAPSGTAGNAVTFTQRMTLTASGQLLLGTTASGSYLLDVNGTGRFTGQVVSNTQFYAIGTPPVNSGALMNIRDTNADGANVSFGGVFFNSSPGTDYSIGKLSENGVGFLQIRNGNNGAELLRIASTGAATFSSTVNATSFTANNRTILTSGGIYDNATNGNDIGFGFGAGVIISTNGVGTYSAQNLGNATYPWYSATFLSTVTASSFSGGVYPYNSILGSGADASTGTVFAGSTNGYVSSINVAGGGATNPNTIIFKTASVERLRINTNITDLTGSFNISEKLGVTGVASVGAKKLSMGILDLNTGVTPTQFKIKTNIPWNYGGSDFTVNIKGFRYGASQMVSLSIGWHYYNSEFYSRNAISNGAWSPIITLAKSSDGFVIIHLPDPGYWAKMYVESVFSSNSADSYTTGWTWTDADLSDCTLIQTVPYKALATHITGNSATTSQTNFTTLTLNSAAVATQSWVQSQAYLTTYTDTLASVTGRGATTSVPITITGSEGREVAVYIPSTYTTDDLVSGHEYGWYSDHWRLGMTRSGGAAGADFVIQWNGTRKLSLTNSGDVTITGTISTVAGNSTQWNTAYGWGNHASAGYATTAYVTTQINNLIDAAPGALDTLNELAAALGDDPNFATTVTSSIAGKVSKAGDVITTSNNYGLVIDHSPLLDDFVDALLLRSTTSGQRAQMGFATVDTDGNHHRASIRAYKGASNYEGVFGIAVRQPGGTHLQRLTLDYLGNLTIGGALTESSSLKLKENINTITGNLEKVLDLRPVAYNKIGSTIKELGLIAEEVAETYPEFVQYDENGEAIGVNYSRLTTVLIGAVKELSDKIKKLETK